MKIRPLPERLRDPALGPRPAAVGGVQAGLSRARAGVLELLTTAGSAMSVTQVATSTGLHPNTAREHLDGLVEAGLASRTRAAAVSRGRPAWLFRSPTAAHRAAGSEYAGLANALVEQLSLTSPDPRAAALDAGRRWGADLAGRARPARTRPARAAGSSDDDLSVTARRTVVGVLADLHFDPVANADATEIRLRTCPILDAARRHPEIVCGVHLGIVGGALEALGAGSGPRVDLVPFAEPGACLLTLQP